MNIRKLQRQAAASTDELLAITGDIGTYVISAYGNVSGEMFAVQCKMQLGRCRRLMEKMRQIDADLAGIASGFGNNIAFAPGSDENGGHGASAAGTGRGQAKSVALTRQLLAQNLLLAGQKAHLLEDFLAHSDSIRSRLKNARDMEDKAQILQLQNTLRRELSPCRNEKENGN